MTSDGSDPPGLQALCDQGLALHRAGRLGEAAQRYNAVLSGDPEHFDALRLLGVLQAQSGRPDEGVALIKRAIRVKPAVATAHVSLGAALAGLNRPAEAVASLDAAITLKPDYFEARFHRASALRALDRRAEALGDLDAAVALNPGSPEAHDLRAIVLNEMGRPDAALESYDAAVALRPTYAEGWNNRGALLSDIGRPEAALASLDRALAVRPEFAEAHFNRGVALDRLNRPEEALAAYDAAIALAPGHAFAHNSRGIALNALGRPIEALASFDAAIALDPGNVDAHLSKSFVLLLNGQFEAGWREYEWRKAGWDAAKRLDPERVWSGKGDLTGKRLFLHGEQGLGDSLQCARYVVQMTDRGAAITVYVHASLVSLLGASLPGVRVTAEGGPPPEFDWHCSLMSLPLAFGTTLETIPPPLRLQSGERSAEFAALLGPKTRPRIGLAWSGNPTHLNDHNRSMAFETLTPLLGENIEWIAIQNEIRPSDAAAFAASGRVAFFGEALNDFTDAAALVEQMDLVISVDTSLAHLAGSLGKPVWILLPYAPDWRWLFGRADSPWYPTARLFRQPALGDWVSVIADVRTAMRSLAERRGGGMDGSTPVQAASARSDRGTTG